ncbi:serine hydrolase domain-containing protein [Algoriphagus zhangzhouensis]|uniref:CubicO group peptidase, beta-lactamase class C family n=1 Tax=Algoriphagus zhangzhouensis TaxID=1073327 RepID=A0A1M7ZGF1_9BACT|nr:serine hydrolase domain-containing protein [Algoriphagus zhangzhouensis]TDY44829.1 CubicO group peptidase (beta-lactamase class C family) [Algoriphagus zhangzhouensis]SHO63879.1 CubicO group peptidase, beta-lactamase class C family [Algoriphagus zhangzhouensis]
MKKTISVLFALFFCLLAPLFAQNQQAEKIMLLMEEIPVMGLSVAVVKDGELVYQEAFGWKEENKVPLSSTDIFRIASISKSFSATSIMQLVEQKKLSLEDDVSDLIGFKVRNPKFPEKVITLKMLLSHTSSMNDSEGYFTLDAINPAKNPNWKKAYNDYAPGEGYQYCNLAYNMTGTIIEKYSGERFDHYIKNHILDPLGLYGGFNVNDLDASKFANIYSFDTKTGEFTLSPAAYAPRKEEIANYVENYSTPIFSPTGGMKISAPDLARYMIMHMNYGKGEKAKIIKKKSSKIMQTPLSSNENYGLALWKTDKLIEGKMLTGHTGSAYGLYSAMFFDPQEKFGIVVMTNGCDPTYENGYNKVIKETVNILYEELIKN